MTTTAGKTWWWLIPALLLVFGLGARGLDMDMLWLDEVFSIGNTGGYEGPAYNPLQVWDSLSHNSPQHMPGYFILLAGWAALTGWTAAGLRALSLLIGLLAVAWTYRLGADWAGRRAGLYAAVMLGIGAFYVYFTHEIRMYTLMAFLTVFTLWAYWRVVNLACVKMADWAALFVGALALLYTHLFGALVLAAVGLYHLLFVPKNRRWLIVVMGLALVGVSILPWLQVLLQGVRNIGLGEAPLTAQAIFTEMLRLFSNGNLVVLVVLTLLALAALVMRRAGAREIWFFLVVIFILTLATNRFRPMISEGRTRYLIHLWPLLALMTGLGLAALHRARGRWLVLPLLAVWLVSGVWSMADAGFLRTMDGPRYLVDYPPLREIVAEVNTRAVPDDLLLTFSRQGHVFDIFRFFTVGDYHTQNLIPQGYFATLPETRSPVEVRGDLLNTFAGRLTVWLAYEPQTPAADLAVFRDVLGEAYRLCATPMQRPDFVIERYALARIGCVDLAAPDTRLVHYDAGIDLHDLRTSLNEAGDELLIAAAWSVGAQVPASTYSVSLKLWDEAGALVAQVDVGLRGTGFGWQLATLPLPDLPDGAYTLTSAVYNWSTGERLSGVGESTQGEELAVAQLRLPGDGESDGA